MTKKPDRRMRVGITLTVLLTMLFTFVFSLDTVSSWWNGSSKIRVQFANVQGIRVSDPVRFQGVNCGRVVSVEFSGAEVRTPGVAFAASDNRPDVGVTLELEVPEAVRDYLRVGSEASIEKTLTGVTVINLTQGQGPPLPPDEILSGVEVATVEEVTQKLDAAVEQVTRILETLNQSIEQVNEEELLVGTLRSLKNTSDETRRLATELGSIAEENHASISQLLKSGAENLGPALTEIKQMVDNVDGFAGEVRGWFMDNRDELSATAEDIAQAAKNAEILSAELRRRPWRLLSSPSKEEALALDLYEAADAYSRGAVALRRSIEHVQTILPQAKSSPANTALLEKAMETLREQIERQVDMEYRFWKRLQDVTD